MSADGSEGRVPLAALLEHRAWVRALARRLVLDVNDADDVEQETWRMALQAPPRRDDSPRGWLAAVVRNAARGLGRKRMRRARNEAAAAAPDAALSPVEIVAAAEIHTRLARAVLDLEEPYRSTVLYRYFEGMDSAQIAARIGVPAATVRTRLARAIERLRERMDVGQHEERAALCLLVFGRRTPPQGAATPAGAPGGVAAAAAAGGLAMAAATKTAVAAVVLVAAGLGWWLWPSAAPTDAVSETSMMTESAAASTPQQRARRRHAPVPAADLAAPGENPPAAQLEAEVVEKPTSVARVSVRRADGSPAGGATVLLLDAWAGEGTAERPVEVARATTDAEGNATLAASRAGGGIVPYAWLGAEAGGSHPLQLSTERPLDVDLQLARAVVVRGRTVDVGGAPLASARVAVGLEMAGSGSWIRFLVASAEDGSFATPPLPVGYPGMVHSVSLRASATSFHPTEVQFATHQVPPEPVLLELYRGGVLRGRLLLPDGRPAAGRGVLELGTVAHATTGADGRFELVLAREPHEVLVLKGGYALKGSRIIPYGEGGWSSPKRLGSFRGDGGDHDLGDVALESGTVVRGRVVDRAGRPVRDAQYLVHLGTQFMGGSRTDADGRFEIGPVGTEPHTVEVREHSRYSAWTPRTARIETVTGDSPELRVVLAGGHAIVVRLLDAATRELIAPAGKQAFDLKAVVREHGSSEVAIGWQRVGGGSELRLVVPRDGVWDVDVEVPGWEPSTAEGVVATADGDAEIEIALRRKPN